MSFWLYGFAKGIGHYFMNVAGALFGAGVHETAGKAVETLGGKMGERMWKYIAPDREDIMKALITLQCNAIIALLKGAERNSGIIDIAGVQYREAWVITKLLEIEERDRAAILVLLDDVCEDDPAEFMAYLNILHNDGLLQLAILLWRRIKDVAGDPRYVEPAKKLASFITEKTPEYYNEFSSWTNKAIASAQAKIDARNERGGIRRWLGI